MATRDIKSLLNTQRIASMLVSGTTIGTLVIVTVMLILTALFANTYLYKITFSPDPVSESDITARQQKINAPLLEQAAEAYTQKTGSAERSFSGVSNPFTPSR